MTDLDKAREWAEEYKSIDHLAPRVNAAIDIILSLPDQWVDVEKVREIIEKMETPKNKPIEIGYDLGVVVATEEWRIQLEALLAPKLPTLADMDEDARHALIGEDVNVEGWNNPSMLVAVHKDEGAVLGHNWINPWPFVEVRPLSELTPVDTAPDQQVNSSESPKSSLPCPEDVPDPHPGEAWLVNTREGEQREALKAGNRWYVKDGDDVEEWVEEALTPISRLVPETHALPEGMRLADHKEYGRVVVSPKDDLDGDYRVFCSQDQTEYGDNWWYAHKSELTFLDGDQHV